MKQKIAFIINPISGTGPKESIPDIIRENLDETQYQPEIVFTEHRLHGRELAKQFVDK
ncbi:MAG: diacylglycerol kinase family protein, partial [Paludibacter sp.]|nr:diacylglycerol kinase family protein [Paludibacter sp.]